MLTLATLLTNYIQPTIPYTMPEILKTKQLNETEYKQPFPKDTLTL